MGRNSNPMNKDGMMMNDIHVHTGHMQTQNVLRYESQEHASMAGIRVECDDATDCNETSSKEHDKHVP